MCDRLLYVDRCKRSINERKAPSISPKKIYCRIGIYRGTKISRKADFFGFSRVLYFAIKQVLQPCFSLGLAMGEFHAIAVYTRQLQIESLP